jgi:pyruvate-formate lyase-activating enzyme
MPRVSLAIFDEAPSSARCVGADVNAAAATVDRRKPYPSCPWLEEGLAFNRRSLNACLIAHHGRGFPHLCDYNGGPIDMAQVLAARARVIAANQAGGHEACRGCPHLVTRRWPRPRHPVRLVGIAQFSRCNIQCSYCYLQTQDPSVYAAGFDPYRVMPALRQLVRDGHAAPGLTVDWGGGEPTVYAEFDDALTFLTRCGATTWVHTNGTRLPKPIRDGLSTKRIHILCSVDAGTRETWKRIKGPDLLETVWRNLEQYVRRGCRVILKYIVKDENCAERELRAFVDRSVAIGVRELVIDVDYDHPDPSLEVLAAIRLLARLSTRRGMFTTFGSTGSFYTPEVDVAGRVKADPDRGGYERLALWLATGRAYAGRQLRLVARRCRYR